MPRYEVEVLHSVNGISTHFVEAEDKGKAKSKAIQAAVDDGCFDVVDEVHEAIKVEETKDGH